LHGESATAGLTRSSAVASAVGNFDSWRTADNDGEKGQADSREHRTEEVAAKVRYAEGHPERWPY